MRDAKGRVAAAASAADKAVGERSTAVTLHPREARRKAWWPVPHPASIQGPAGLRRAKIQSYTWLSNAAWAGSCRYTECHASWIAASL